MIEDQPDAVVVFIFPDNVFKYASSFERHFPHVRATPSADARRGEPSEKEQLLTTLVENSRNPHNTWEVEDLRTALEGPDSRPFLLDVRKVEVYAKRHVAGATNIPLGELGDRRGELPEQLERSIVTVCDRGNLSISGMLFLQSLGYQNVRSLNGGTIAWAEQGLPTNNQPPAVRKRAVPARAVNGSLTNRRLHRNETVTRRSRRSNGGARASPGTSRSHHGPV